MMSTKRINFLFIMKRSGNVIPSNTTWGFYSYHHRNKNPKALQPSIKCIHTGSDRMNNLLLQNPMLSVNSDIAWIDSLCLLELQIICVI